MYLNHYHLKAKPFDLSPGPHFLWLGEKHKEALATLNYGIIEDLGFLLLTGDVGVGKTALIHRLISNLDASTIVAHITDPGLGILDFFKLLAAEFNIAKDFRSKAEFLIELEKFLYSAYSDRKKVLLIVDEAQRLNSKLLDQIRVLSNIELSNRKLINIFFVGQPEFKNMLMDSSSRAMRQRIAINYHINPLTESETGQYIGHRLKMAGATRKIFKSNAIHEIFRFTGGYPRAINVICDHALLTGYAGGLQSIDSEVIKECQQELNIRAGFDFSRHSFQAPTKTNRPAARQPSPRQSMHWGYPLLIGTCIVLSALLFSYYLLWPGPHWTMKLFTQKKMAPSPHSQADTLADQALRQSATSEKKPIQASPKKVTTPAQPHKINANPEKTAPKDEIAAGSPTAVATAQATPAPDRLPGKSALEGGADGTVPTEKALAAPSAPADAQPLPPPDAAAGNRLDAQLAAAPKDKTAADRQPAIFTAQASPAPDRLPGNSALEGNADGTVPTEKALAAPSAPADAQPLPPPDAAAGNRLDAQLAAAPKDKTAADRQPAIFTAQASPAPDRLPGNSALEGGADGTVPTEKATQKEALKKPVESIPRNETLAAERQPTPSADQATPVPDQLPRKSKPDGAETIPGKRGRDGGLVAVLSDGQPKPQLDRQVRMGTATGQSATTALSGTPPQGPNAAKLEGAPKTPSSIPATGGSSREADSDKPYQTENNAQPVQAALDNRPEPTIVAKTETRLQPSAETIKAAALTAEKPDSSGVENRLRSFLDYYCSTYAAKDFAAFTRLFVPDAMENGEPFESLSPKYKKNFSFIETIEYRIEMQQFSYDEDNETIKIEGDFFLKWLPPDKEWRQNTGKIYMSLKENGPSFMVQQLDYHGSPPPKQ